MSKLDEQASINSVAEPVVDAVDIQVEKVVVPIQSAPAPIVCRHFLKGVCLFGDACRNIHDETQKESVPLCKYFMSGRCTYGRQCLFRHQKFQQVRSKRSTQPRKAEPEPEVVTEKIQNSFAVLSEE